MNRGHKELVLLTIISINVLSAFFGFIFFYGEQLSATPLALWVFVPDCPMAAALVAVALLLLRSRIRPNLLLFIIFVFAVKYGFWTAFVLATYASFYLPANGFLLYSFLFLGHVGLFLEAFLLLGKIKLKPSYIAYSIIFFVLNDFSDYVLGTAPPLPPGTYGLIFPVTLIMSFFFTFFAYYVIEHYSKPIIELF